MFYVNARQFKSEAQIKLAIKYLCKELNVCHKPVMFNALYLLRGPQGGASPLFYYNEFNQIKLRNFHLFINMINLSDQSALSILAHECIHIQQMSTQRLHYIVPDGAHLEATFIGTTSFLQPNILPIIKWEGEDFTEDFIRAKRCRDTYFSLPWECEAFDMQDELKNTLTFEQLYELEQAGKHGQELY